MKNTMKDMIRFLRKRNGLSQEELAKRLNISRTALAGYEQGIRRPSYEVLETIADYFDVSISTLLGVDTDYLTEDEIALIQTYRDASETHKKVILAYVKALNQLKKEGDEK